MMPSVPSAKLLSETRQVYLDGLLKRITMSRQHVHNKESKTTKNINEQADITAFMASEAFERLMTFLMVLNTSVIGLQIPKQFEPAHGEMITRLCTMLDTLHESVSRHPPLDEPQRYGNTAFRGWVSDQVLASDILQRELQVNDMEVSLYFSESFGNATRIDYGTGHELNFVAFLCSLDLLGLVD